MTDREAFVAAVDVSRETLARLDEYAALLTKWNPSINLVSKSTLPFLWRRHFLDSAQVMSLARETARTWVDLGTGGGFPGMIVAILAADRRPDLHVSCVESDTRKATFLRTVARACGIQVDVISRRIEEIEPMSADILSARALAPLTVLLDYADRHLSPSGEAVFLKGASFEKEIAEALETWAFELDTYPSETDPDATLLKLKEIRRV